jgi:hypothetical protein
MKIQQPRQAWGGKSHKELKSLLHSIPRQELGMKALEESEFGLLELRMRACSTGKWSSQERRAIRGGWVYIELSQESSCWAQIQNLDNVRGCRSKFGWAGQCSARGFYEVFLNSRLTRVGLDNVRLIQTMSDWEFLFWMGCKRLGVCSTRWLSLHPTRPS